MELMRVLVVEDNSVVADAVAEGLRDEGIAVDVAYDGPAGLDKVTVNTYDVIVLDRDLPRLHGDALCQQIVDSPSTSRILMLTAAALVEDRVNGLNLGADDYLAKPFDFSELVARVRALARRSPSTPPVLTRGDLIVDRARRAVTRAGLPGLQWIARGVYALLNPVGMALERLEARHAGGTVTFPMNLLVTARKPH